VCLPEYYAQYDLIWWSEENPARAESIKALNPDIMIVVTRDINAGAGMTLPDEWIVKSSKKEICVPYTEEQPYANYTDFAPRLPEYGNKRFNEYVADYFLQVVDLSVFDGAATDGLWSNNYTKPPCDQDIDLDRNEINDYDEHGSQWVNYQIRQGAIKVVQNLRAAIGPDKLLMINSGTQHNWGMEETNGFLDERFGGMYNFDWAKNRYDDWAAGSAQPSMPIVQTCTSMNAPIEPDRNDFQLMRYGLTLSLITGAYVEFIDYKRAGEHYWIKYFDEYDLDLGYPTGPAQKTSSGAWVRFFDNGMAVINGTDDQTITVTVNQIMTLSGYNPGNTGVYWRLRGGQNLAINGDHAMNNGDPFDESHPIILNVRSTWPTVGDGVVLMREPQIAVAPIVVDNWNSGTSPGSFSPSENKDRDMAGFLQATECFHGSDYYTVRCAVYNDPNTSPPDTTYLSPPFATAPGGSNAHAIYTPNIGIPGLYKIFEWHGKLAQGQLASNVNYTISHAEGNTVLIVDQTTNSGQWNSLGTYSFKAGDSGNVAITSLDANNTVMADAIKFVFQGEGQSPTFIDVPFDYWAHDDIEVLYQEGYVAGCNLDPLMYCPDDTMNRAESAVFVERGIHTAEYMPTQPTTQVFADVALDQWYAKWANGLWEDKYTAGCGVDPLIYCPLLGHTRAEGCVFYLRMMHGVDYLPPDPTGIFVDAPVTEWYAKWVEAAYNAGLIEPCQTSPEMRFCPNDPLSRALGATMMVNAKDLPLP
jgi:hypothetical protein